MSDGDKLKQAEVDVPDHGSSGNRPTSDVTAQHGQAVARPVQVETQPTYNMNHPKRGKALIINQMTFHPITEMVVRNGTDSDANGLETQLGHLGFDVEIKNDLTKEQMQTELEKVAKMDHRNADCFVCAILSYGEEGVVYGTDGTVQIKDLLEPFKGNKCSDLAGKPKIFIIQACRSSDQDVADVADGGALSNARSDVVYNRIPAEADFLMVYSVVPGYFSWKSNPSNGSWFIQAVVSVLEEHGDKLDLLTMITRVNKRVGQRFPSDPHASRTKQLPCITSMLTREVYFSKKGNVKAN